MSLRRLLSLVVIVLWVLLGPVGMTFSCLEMMDGCDALCWTSSAAVQIPAAVAAEAPLNWVGSSLEGHLPLNSGHVLDAPPKSAPRS